MSMSVPNVHISHLLATEQMSTTASKTLAPSIFCRTDRVRRRMKEGKHDGGYTALIEIVEFDSLDNPKPPRLVRALADNAHESRAMRDLPINTAGTLESLLGMGNFYDHYFPERKASNATSKGERKQEGDPGAIANTFGDFWNPTAEKEKFEPLVQKMHGQLVGVTESDAVAMSELEKVSLGQTENSPLVFSGGTPARPVDFRAAQMLDCLLVAHHLEREYMAKTGQPLTENVRAMGITMFIQTRDDTKD